MHSGLNILFSQQDGGEDRVVRMQPVVREALQLIRSVIPADIQIVADIRKDSGIIKADPTQIHQVVMNLATNAYQAMAETGGELRVTLESEYLEESTLPDPDMTAGRYVRLTVSDTGIGMDKETLGKIFDPYFSIKKRKRGAGLGLAVVHGIVKRTGGGISVQSAPGRGAMFSVFFPFFAETRKSAPAP